jgi:hypothetical protein
MPISLGYILQFFFAIDGFGMAQHDIFFAVPSKVFACISLSLTMCCMYTRLSVVRLVLGLEGGATFIFGKSQKRNKDEFFFAYKIVFSVHSYGMALVNIVSRY